VRRLPNVIYQRPFGKDYLPNTIWQRPFGKRRITIFQRKCAANMLMKSPLAISFAFNGVQQKKA
jgi:hypothetical protein